MTRKKQKGNQTLALYLLGMACVAVLIVLITLVIVPVENQTIKKGKFTPPPFESAAVFGVPEVDESLGWSELSVRADYIAHVCGVLRVNADGTVPVWFYSDAENDVWLKLRMKNADGNTIGETGILKPGEYVEMIELYDPAYSGKVTLQIMGYEPETYYSAGSVSLETELTRAD